MFHVIMLSRFWDNMEENSETIVSYQMRLKFLVFFIESMKSQFIYNPRKEIICIWTKNNTDQEGQLKDNDQFFFLKKNLRLMQRWIGI